MCGICGSTRDPDGLAVTRMNAVQVHRGPDDEGVWIDRAAGVALGARRLAIIDLPGGHQPLSNEEGDVWVVLNGEIYNHEELRQMLRARGHTFRTSSDTEVLVHLYEEYGDALVHALDGMFAFAIWDVRRERMLVARDRFGEKPLFYHEGGGVLTFASELSALTRGCAGQEELDPAAVDAFFVLGYVPGPETIVAGIRQLPPGHLMAWSRGPGAHLEQYWDPPRTGGRPPESLDELTVEAARLLRSSLKRRLRADVPVGVLLSGGVDSTIIAGLTAELRTTFSSFTVTYDVGEVGEGDAARKVAERLGSEHHELVLRAGDVDERARRCFAQLDQPLADQALVPLHALSEFARQSVKVAVAGEGADELFGGYPRYRWIARAHRFDEVLPSFLQHAAGQTVARRAADPTGRRAARLLVNQPVLERHLDWVTTRRRHERCALYGPALTAHVNAPIRLPATEASFAGAADGELVGRLMGLDQRLYLPDDVLVKSDRASMAAGLELRTPYLDRELAEFALSLDAGMHMRPNGKVLLRRILAQVIQSPGLERQRKIGFRAPAGEWLRGPLDALMAEQVATGAAFSEGWFNRRAVDQLRREHVGGARDHAHILWPVLSFGVWLDALRRA